MKIKTSELIGPALDWAVAKCEAHKTSHFRYFPKLIKANNNIYRPSTDWSQGGSIIEKLRNIGAHNFMIESDGDNVSVLVWQTAHVFHVGYGPTLLIAAMRCYVASRLGDEVEIPEELL